MHGRGYRVNKPICIDKDPLELSIEEIEHLNIEECVWSTYRELVMRKPRKKIYWQKEIEYRERVLRMLEERKLRQLLAKGTQESS